MSYFATVFMDWIILHGAGLASSLIVINLLFDRRNSYKLWIIYFGCRAVLRSLASALIITDMMTPALVAADVVFIAVTAVANFVVMYYTWDAEPLKICLAGLMSDLICGTAMVLGITAANVLSGNDATPSIDNLNPFESLVAFAIIMMIVFPVSRLLKPAASWFRNVEVTHQKLLTVLVIFGISMFSTTNITDNGGLNNSIIFVCLVTSLMLVPLIILILKNISAQQSRRVLLRQQAEMTSAYIMAAYRQSESIDAHRKLLDSLRERIEDSGETLKNTSLRAYVAELRDLAAELQAGRYTGDMALDAELTAFAGRFDSLGYTAEFSCVGITGSQNHAVHTGKTSECLPSDAAKPGEDAYEEGSACGRSPDNSLMELRSWLNEITWVLLSWAVKAISSEIRKDAASRGDDPSEEKRGVVNYTIIKEGNQVIFSLTITGLRKRHFPERLLADYLGTDDVVSETGGGNMTGISIMKEVRL